MDAQLPLALARLISDCGHKSEHVFDFTLESAPDSEIWKYALNTGAVIVTKDEDFIHLASVSKQAPPIVWIRTGNLSKKALLNWFQPLLSEIIEKIESGESLIELI